jgi:hypothetical protein
MGEVSPEGWCLARRHWDTVSSRDLVMRLYLCAAERADYERLGPRDQGPWLLGRIAAKDAVRNWLWDHGHGPLFPVELTIRDNADGTPEVTGPFETTLSVSIAHTAELGVALVRRATDRGGIALVPISQADGGPGHREESGGASLLRDDGDVLTTAERALLKRLPDDRATAMTRVRAAKAVAAKITGSGASVVTAVHRERLRVESGDGAGEVTEVASRVVDGHVVAWTAAARTGRTDDMGEM